MTATTKPRGEQAHNIRPFDYGMPLITGMMPFPEGCDCCWVYVPKMTGDPARPYAVKFIHKGLCPAHG